MSKTKKKMNAVIFKNKEQQERFERDGYIVIDLLSAEEAKDIAAIFYKTYKNIPEGFYSVAEHPDGNLKQTISNHIEQILGPKIDSTFQDYKKLGSTFLCKTPGEKGKVPVHQDWMVVDESKYFSATVWIPTIDTTEENGAMRVLPGSHRFFQNIRSSTLPMPYQNYQQLIWENMITVPMKAGQAFIHNHAVIHSSTINTTNTERLSIVYGLAPQPASLVFYHKNEAERVEKYDMPDDMFLRYFNLGERPAFGKKTDEFYYPAQTVDEATLTALITTARKERNLTPFFKTPSPAVRVVAPTPKTEEPKQQSGKNQGSKHNRSFSNKYTLSNIIKEIKWRLLA